VPPCFDRLDLHAIPHIGMLGRLAQALLPCFTITNLDSKSAWGAWGSPSPAPVSVKRPKDLVFRTSITIRSQLRVAAMKRLDHTGWAQVSAHLDTSLPDDVEAAWGFPEPRWYEFLEKPLARLSIGAIHTQVGSMHEPFMRYHFACHLSGP